MKHVLVLDALSESVGFLNAQGLKGGAALANLPYDTMALGNHYDALQSEDGIQFYHFTRQKNPALNQGHFRGGEHIETYLQALKEKLDRKNKAISNPANREQLDAIVIPGGILEGIQTVRFIAKLRQTWPNVKVMVTQPKLHGADEKLNTAHFIKVLEEPIHPMYGDKYWINKNNNYALYEPVRRGTQGFWINDQVDVVTLNAGRGLQADILREELDMEPLSRYRSADAPATSAVDRYTKRDGGPKGHGGRG